MNKTELIGKLQMVYVGDKNALDELVGYYDGLKQVIEQLQQENKQLNERINKAINVIENLDKEDIDIWIENKYWVYVLEILRGTND